VGGVSSMVAARVAVAGEAEGLALVTDEPLSFWGGVDPRSGEIIDRHHPLRGANLAGRVLALPHGRGSCSASGVLLESIVNGAGPAAILTTRVDPILGLGAILAEELHGRSIPVLVLAAEDFYRLRTGDRIAIDRAGRLQVESVA
jgi:cis-L-3-hydroxyproline dehydratase